MKYMMLIAGDEANWNGRSEDEARGGWTAGRSS